MASSPILVRWMLVAMAVLWVCAASAAPPARARGTLSDATPLEAAFSARAGTPLALFGYDLFAAGDAAPRGPAGAVQDDYVLGPGDALTVTLRGQTASSKRYTIDGEGKLLVDELRPLSAAGRTLRDLRGELEATVRAAHMLTDVYVALAEIRRVGIVVTGAVARPGRHDLTSFSTVLDALTAAGGVTRAGSLRRITLMRAGAPPATIDLYELQLAGGGAAAERIREGDRLLVPPLGATVAVAGPVKRPGVFELPPGRERLSTAELRDLAGGLIRPGTLRALRLGLRADGTESAEPVADPAAAAFGDGDLLMLAPLREDRRGVVRLEGHVLRPGPRPLSEVRTLIDLVGERDLKPGAYRAFAVVAGANRTTGVPALVPVDLAAVLDGRGDRRLADGDTLHILGADDVDFLTSEAVLALLRDPRAPPREACRGLVALARRLAADPAGPLARGPQAQAAAGMAGGDAPCPALFDEHPDLLAFALSHAVLTRGGDARPGFYPVAGRAAAAAVSGGRRTAPARAAPEIGEVLDPTEPRLELLGHVRHPGVRPLPPGTTLRAALEDGEALADGVYGLAGVIERFDRRTLTTALIPFSPQDIAAGRADRTLADRDRIHVFSAERVRALMRPAAGIARAAATTAQALDPEAFPAADPAAVAAVDVDPAIAGLLRERAVQMRGAVRQPGAYPVADAVPLEALIAAAGGLVADADRSAIEVTPRGGGGRRSVDLTRPDARGVAVAAGDAVRVNPGFATIEPRAVTILGEVRRPGSYDVLRGERLSSLIARAGGLTADAYPAGAVFSREAERRRRKEEMTQQALTIDRGVLLLEQSGDEMPAKQAARARQLAAQLRAAEPVGRITVEADPAVLAARPELDVVLEADDRIVVPKRPLTVMVAGEVLNPGAFQFVTGRDADDYIRDAGGPTRDADEGRIHVVLPNGRSEPLSLSSWNHTITAIPPGSLVVVPADPRPYGSLKEIAGILGQLAITAASISVIAR